MSQVTKHALGEALKELLRDRTLDKVTIADLTGRCGMNRMTFYYHFKDIYDLVAWTLAEEAHRALEDTRSYATWQQGYLRIFETVRENKGFMLNVYRSVSREQVETYLYSLTHKLLTDVINELAEGIPLREDDRAFIADIYKYVLVGLLLDWIRNGLRDDPERIVSRLELALRGNLSRAIEAFRTDGKTRF